MSSNTQNLDLILPEQSDYYNSGVHFENYSKIDAAYGDTNQKIDKTVLYATKRFVNQNSELIAHRGLNSVANEQTELAFIKAYENGIKSWECDVQNTSDGELVLVHDLTLSRTTNDNRIVTSVPYSEIANIDSSKLVPYYSPSYILKFDDFLKLAKSKSDVIVYPEISPYQSSAAKTKTVDLIIENGMENRCVIQSFNFNDFSGVRSKSQLIKLGYLAANISTFNSAFSLASADGNADILCDYNILLNNPSLVKNCYENGVGLAVWTVNDLAVAKRLKAIGVTRIMSDKLVGGF